MDVDIIFKYFKDLDEWQKEKIKDLQRVYNFYNEQVNLISRKDISNLYEHHILHSLSLAKVMNLKEGDKIIDIGSGGGLPGIPLAILFPQAQFILLDSTQKKIRTVNAIIEDLKLKNISTVCERAEQHTKKYNYIIGRGVCCFDKFVDLVKHLKGQNAKIVYINGDSDIPMKKHRIMKISDFFEEEYFNGKFIREVD